MAGDDGSWEELRCSPGCPEPEPPPPSWFSSCHADMERMLLEAQLETESGEGPRLLLASPAWHGGGAGAGSEHLGRGEPGRELELSAAPCTTSCAETCAELPLARCSRDGSEEDEWRTRRLPASLASACAHRPRHRSPKEVAFACSLRPVPWSLPGGAVERKKRLFSSELLLLFIPSLLLSHLLTLGLGIYIGKRLAASSANPL
ncbi:BCL2/adenovirus E1B 19 kDa protein-interacting protein 3-like [Phaenicophaeus curvirostris]|uniref:BCL2/adenovirus E1B 19 kDa protein-interacting protein 3-like n=1 Tax=Phaenicophaeus curvirostris TaxID=33595 RepID=UPI0037F0D3EB